jgi:hypothetical protein
MKKNPELVQLRLLKPWKIYDVGEVVTVPPGTLPERMIKNGTAERYLPDKKKDKNKI